MIKRIKSLILTAAFAMTTLVPVAVPAIASAAVDTNNNVNNGLCTGVTDATGTTGQGCFTTDASGNSLRTIAAKVVNYFSIIVGIVAVIMIIYGGFRYITSGGDSGRVGNAKNTLIYAIIGLIIVALSQFIVHFVLTTSTQAVS